MSEWSRILEDSSRADDCSGTWPVVPATARHRTVPQGKSRHAYACKRWASARGAARNGER